MLRAKHSLLECDLEFSKDHSHLAFSVSRGKRVRIKESKGEREKEKEFFPLTYG